MKKVLLLDDDPQCRDLMTEILSQRDYLVDAFCSPAELFAQRGTCGCRDDHLCADLIVTDNRMPGLFGVDFLRQIADAGCQLPGHRKALVTGHCTMEEYALVLKMGCSVFFKPAYFDAINNWLDQLAEENRAHLHT